MNPPKIGRFEIRCHLGASSFGEVYRGYDPVLDREVALKIPRTSVLERPETKARFLREAKAAARLSHPNIVPVFDAGCEGDRYYIASAYVEGQTLRSRIVAHRPDFRKSAALVRDLAEALDYAHRQGIVHRDVKPANIMLDRQGAPLLMDFGLARVTSEEEEKLTREGAVLGTPAYMAPEQAEGSWGEVGPASDQYSLGVVLYELLCGQTPHSGPATVVIFKTLNAPPESLRKRNASVPKDLETICLKALARRPSDRYGDCQELAGDLQRWLNDEPIRARRMGIIERASRWSRRNPLLAALSLVIVVLAVLSTAIAGRLVYTRAAIAGTVRREQDRRGIVTSETQTAEAQTRLAQQREDLAKQKAAAAKEALAKLKAAVEARNQAEAEKKVEAARRAKLGSELQQQTSRLSEATNDLKATKIAADKAAGEKLAAAHAHYWSKVGVFDGVIAVDAALREGRRDTARSILDACPPEKRAWEWYQLSAVCEGFTPEIEMIPLHEEEEVVVSGNAAWLAVLGKPEAADALGPGIYRLPELERVEDLQPQQRLTYALLTSDGKTLLTLFDGTAVVRTTGGKTIKIPSALTPYGPVCSSPDGQYLVYHSVKDQILVFSVTEHEFLRDTDGKLFKSKSKTDRRHTIAASSQQFTVSGSLMIVYCECRSVGSQVYLSGLLRGEMWVDGSLTTRQPGDIVFPRRLTNVIGEKIKTNASFAKSTSRVSDVPTYRGIDQVLVSRDLKRAVLSWGQTSWVADLSLKRHIYDSDDYGGWFAEMPRTVALSPDGTRIVVLDSENRLRLMDPVGKRELPPVPSLRWCKDPVMRSALWTPAIVISLDWTRLCAIVAIGKGRRLYCATMAPLPGASSVPQGKPTGASKGAGDAQSDRKEPSEKR